MNSADAWHESNGIGAAFEQYLEVYNKTTEAVMAGNWPEDPNGDMVPILEASVEAAKERHPSGVVTTDVALPEVPAESLPDTLTAADRCDTGCGGAALFMVSAGLHPLAYCHHHAASLLPGMPGWKKIGQNSSLMEELYGGRSRSQGSDHA